MGNQVAKPVETRNATLSSYFEYLFRDVLCFKRSVEEINDITESVNEMVRVITDEICKVDERFKISKIYFVGSMKEGTSNEEPGEFDFLVVIDSLSMTSDISVLRKCKGFPGHSHIEVKEHTPLADIWKDITDNRNIKSSRSGLFDKSGIMNKFQEVLGQATQRQKGHEITEATGKLVMNHQIFSPVVGKHGPACVSMFRWVPYDGSFFSNRNLNISVDITPAIQIGDVKSVVDETEVRNTRIYKHLLDVDSFMLIPGGNTMCTDGLCFRLTFTDTEMVMMKELSNHHRKCYRILKYLFSGGGHTSRYSNIFHSYALKTFVIMHHFEKVCDDNETGKLSMCILEIIDAIQKCLDLRKIYWLNVEVNLPNIILPSQNVFERHAAKSKVNRNIIELKNMILFLIRIADSNLHANEELQTNQFKKYAVYFVDQPQIHAPQSTK